MSLSSVSGLSSFGPHAILADVLYHSSPSEPCDFYLTTVPHLLFKHLVLPVPAITVSHPFWLPDLPSLWSALLPFRPLRSALVNSLPQPCCLSDSLICLSSVGSLLSLCLITIPAPFFPWDLAGLSLKSLSACVVFQMLLICTCDLTLSPLFTT